MSNRTAADPQVHLHWVRETPSRALDFPISSSPQSLKSLPPCVQTAVLATGLATVELHLPPYRPSHSPDLAAWLAKLQFRQNAAGRLIGTPDDDADPRATMAFHQAMVLVMRAVSGDTTPLTIVAEHGLAGILPRPLAARHRCAPDGGLAKAPAERGFGYDRAYKATSIAIQTAVRAAVPPAHIGSIDSFSEPDQTLAILTWGAAAPVTGRHVDELGVEVLKPRMIGVAFYRLPDRLAVRLAEVREILLRHRASPVICDSLKPSRAERLGEQCRRRPKLLNQLFSNEVRLISNFVQFCARISGWRARAAGNPASIFREVRDSWEGVETIIRHFYLRRPYSALGSILLLEAVRVLEAVDLNNGNELRGQKGSSHGWTGIHRK